MIQLRLLIVLIGTVFLTGCLHRVAPPSGPPGAVQLYDNCYYKLDITYADPSTGEVRGKVPQQVVKENGDKVGTFFGWQFGGWFWRRLADADDLKTYSFFEYSFQVQTPFHPSIKAGATIEFHSVKGDKALSFGAPPPDATMKKVENPCLPPGQTATQQCYYKLTITQINATDGSAKGIVPPSVMEDNAKLFPHLAAKVHRSPEYTFRVRDSKTLRQGSDYDFVSVPHTDYLERCAKPNCEEEFPR